MGVRETVIESCKAARQASRALATTSTNAKNHWLHAAAAGLRSRQGRLLEVNRADVARGRSAGLSAALLIG